MRSILLTSPISLRRQTVQSMIASNSNNNKAIMANQEIKSYVEGMRRKFTSDFGRNMKHTSDLIQELQKRIDEIERQGKNGNKQLSNELASFVRELTQNNTNLEKEMKDRGIDVSGIKLKK